MSKELTPNNALPPRQSHTSGDLSFYIRQATSDNTRRAYRQDIKHFQEWGGLLPTDTKTVIHYLHHHASLLSPSTLQRRLVSLRHFHNYQGFDDPTAAPSVQKIMTGIMKTHGKPADKAPALRLEQLEHCIESWKPQDNLRDARNQALLCVGFFGAFRGSELLGIQVEHLSWEEAGVSILIPKSKTDRTNSGQKCALPAINNAACPVNALKNWLNVAQIDAGFVFRSIRANHIKQSPLTLMSLNTMIKQQADRCKFNKAEKFSSHSLRRGLATSASAVGASFQSIMRQGRWKHEGTVLEYIEEGQQFQDNVVNSFYDSSG